ncbi:MAG: HDIG domain-containing metalloprotein, partial [Bacteroidota bacterium]
RTYGGQDWLLIFLGQFLIVTFITLILLSNLSVTRPRIFFSNPKLSLILFTLLLAVASMVIATKLTDVAVRLVDILGPNVNLSYIYLAPACIVPIFISSFFEHRLGFLCNLLVALYGAVLVQQGLEFAFVQTMAGTVAVYNLRRLRKRERFFYTLGYIFLTYSISYIVFNLLSKGGFNEINYHTLLLFAINVAITMIAYNLIYLLERVFGETSDLTYLELLDTNHPLLQELARKAPGTFQHSLQVANLAELTINEIGGNALLVHVGALYHDVGKMPHSNYFIENMSESEHQRNPHDSIDCLESAEIIIGHVKNGVELAHRYHLPREIINFIETHHGTTRVEYFYRMYIQSQNCLESEADNLFRYPGPLPFSKETAVLMISDSVEAASRATKKPTAEKLKQLVDSIIDHKIKDGQLENSNLTFKDIASIRRVMKKQLMNIYHGRIEYP